MTRSLLYGKRLKENERFNCKKCGIIPVDKVYESEGPSSYGHSGCWQGVEIIDVQDRPGYHLRTIAKGEIGELSKVQEELDELKDAELQGVRVMQLVEASDLVGALVRWLEAKHPGTTLEDLIAMHKVTRRAFENGKR